MLADGRAVEGDWLVALRQDAGRGRQGRQWQSLDGNFFGSTLVRLVPGDPSPPTLALVAGLALIDAIEAAAPGVPVSLKWPNDVMRGRGKLAGILLERAEDRVVAGFGVNLAVAPAIANRDTASLGDRAVSVEAFAPLLAGCFGRMLVAWRSAEPASLVRAWTERAHPVGTPLKVHVGKDETISGTFDGIEPDGALRLKTIDGAVESIRAGDVGLG